MFTLTSILLLSDVKNEILVEFRNNVTFHRSNQPDMQFR